MSSNVTLDNNSFLFEKLEISPAKEAPDVPLDGDGCPCLGAVPFVLQLLIQKLFKENL